MNARKPGMLSEKCSRENEKHLQKRNICCHQHIEHAVISFRFRTEEESAAFIRMIHTCRKVHLRKCQGLSVIQDNLGINPRIKKQPLYSDSGIDEVSQMNAV